MASLTIRDEILNELDRLPETTQRQVLEIVRSFPSPTPSGTPIEDLFSLSGSLDEESAREMEEAIEAGCVGGPSRTMTSGSPLQRSKTN